MTKKEFDEIIRKHKMWLENKAGGEQAYLRRADLRNADLSGADLRRADLCVADLRGAYLCGANLYGANLQGADLCRADLDFSCWPLWCGSLDVVIDKRIAAQLAYHFCRTICDDPEVKAYQKMLAPLANQFHRVNECGKIKEE